jgi:uncharacterized protein
MNQAKRILIAGGSGLIGMHLTKMLHETGYEVWQLSRRKGNGKVKSFLWDIDTAFIQEGAFENVSVIINLSGSSVAEGRWTSRRKKEIMESRTKSTALLHQRLSAISHEVNTFISASGVGYYGAGDESRTFTEDDEPGDDFLARVTVAWEKEADRFRDLGIRVVKVRIGVVLTETGGALQPIARTVRAFIGAPLGSGKQYLSWIHIEDLCRIVIAAIEDPTMGGPYNAVAPAPVTNAEFTRVVARVLRRPMILPAVPGFFLRTILGEMAVIVLEGAKVSSGKIRQTGFRFRFDSLPEALKDLLGRDQ